MRRDDDVAIWTSMKSPVVVVALTLTVAILVAASFLIMAGTRKSSGTSTLQIPSSMARSHTAAGPLAVARDALS